MSLNESTFAHCLGRQDEGPDRFDEFVKVRLAEAGLYVGR